jgi:Flp pilus assembly protein TadG
MIRRRLARLGERLRNDARGVAAVEFAITVPVLLLVYLGGFELSQAMATYRKVSDTTVELANVAAQYTTIGSTDATSIFSATSQIMSPFSTQNLSTVLTVVQTDSNSVATVYWSKTSTGAPGLPTGQVVTLPTGMASQSSCYVLVQATYQYNPTIGSAFVGSIPMSDQIYMQPRSSPCITPAP